jgi:hypothetical protein
MVLLPMVLLLPSALSAAVGAGFKDEQRVISTPTKSTSTPRPSPRVNPT